jgi:hypothetical protein
VRRSFLRFGAAIPSFFSRMLLEAATCIRFTMGTFGACYAGIKRLED